MASLSVKSEDRLVGAANFNAWKYRIINILEENDLEDFITMEIEEPTTNTARATYKRKQTKAKRIIFYSIKDNMMPLIGHLRTAKDCFDALENLYEKKEPTQKRILKKQLHTLKMGKDDTVATFFSKIAQTKDQLIAIGVPVDDDDLVQTTFHGLPAA
jgi:glutaredoxin 2